jgi:hypothetical protein
MTTDSKPSTPPLEAAEAPRPEAQRKESKELRGLLRAERATTKAASRLTRAVARGLEEYQRRSEKSANKRRDGAIHDMARNAAAAVGEVMREASEVPSDLAKAISPRPKVVRRVLRALRSSFRR